MRTISQPRPSRTRPRVSLTALESSPRQIWRPRLHSRPADSCTELAQRSTASRAAACNGDFLAPLPAPGRISLGVPRQHNTLQFLDLASFSSTARFSSIAVVPRHGAQPPEEQRVYTAQSLPWGPRSYASSTKTSRVPESSSPLQPFFIGVRSATAISLYTMSRALAPHTFGS